MDRITPQREVQPPQMHRRGTPLMAPAPRPSVISTTHTNMEPQQRLFPEIHQRPTHSVRCSTASDQGGVVHKLCRSHTLRLACGKTLQICCARPTKITGLPSGLKCWPSSVVLLHLFAHTNIVRGKTVLELGAGAGLAGLAACVAGGAKHTVLTYCDRLVLRLLEHNLSLNYRAIPTGNTATIRRLDWTSQVDMDELLSVECARLRGGFDVLLASENTYSPEAIRAFWRAACFLLHEDGVLVVARELRTNGLETSIMDGAAEAGFAMQAVPLASFMPDWPDARCQIPDATRTLTARCQMPGPQGSHRPEAPEPCEWDRYHVHVCKRKGTPPTTND